MSKNAHLVFLLMIVLLCTTTIQNAKGTWSTRGWIGRYLMVDYIQSETATWEFTVNRTIGFEIMLRNWHTIFVKTIDIQFWIADAYYNKTIKDYYWELPPHTMAGAMSIEDIELTPHLPHGGSGLCYIIIHADYQYDEGNQTIEQEGDFELSNFAEVHYTSYYDLASNNQDLSNTIAVLNSTNQNLTASYSNLGKYTYLLGITAIVFIGTTLTTLIVYGRKRNSKV